MDQATVARARAKGPSKRSIRARKIRQMLSSAVRYWYELRRCRNLSDVGEWLYYKAPIFFPLRRYPSVVNFEITNNCNSNAGIAQEMR